MCYLGFFRDKNRISRMCVYVCIDYIYIYKIINFIYYIYFMCIIKKRIFSGNLYKLVERGRIGGYGIVVEEDMSLVEVVVEVVGCRGYSRILVLVRRGYERISSSSGVLNFGFGVGFFIGRCYFRRCFFLDRFCEGGV